MGLFSRAECMICNSVVSKMYMYKLADDSYICENCIDRVGLSDGFPVSALESSRREDIEKRIEIVEKNRSANIERLKKFAPSTKFKKYIWFDDRNKWFVFPKGTFKTKIDGCHVFEYKDILSFEVLENGTSITKGGLGKALVGGALFGVAGAVVGGTSKREKQICTSLQLKITTRNLDYPVVYISFIKAETDRNGIVYSTECKNVQDILSKFQIIVDQLSKSTKNKMATQNNATSIADEIKKFKQLFDDGVITKTEFEAKKKKLLDL